MMRSSVGEVHELVSGIEPGDDVEVGHRAETLRWLESTDDVFRRAKPATPPRHLVTYIVLVDDPHILLADHIKAGLWLPPGGHVEPDEHPAETARRELDEELGVRTHRFGQPSFITVTQTVGADPHTDVSLWFVLPYERDLPLVIDRGEFHQVRWWSRTDIAAANPASFDPHLSRFLTKAFLT
jgi:ADP-ribose pyrophosphatase YjhB (NUDIX family)